MNMTLLFVRILFVICCAILGYHVGETNQLAVGWTSLAGLFFGAIIMVLEAGMRGISLRGLSSAVFGLILGLVIGRLLGSALFAVFPMDETVQRITMFVLTLSFSYLGVTIALRGRDEFNLIIPYVKFRRQDEVGETILLDTSAIIDGRIIDMMKAHFLEGGQFTVPRFVLRELQMIADSSDATKRQRGRRGLEILNKIQQDSRFHFVIYEEDFKDILDVDAKLVKLAKVLEAKIFTVDYNLNRIAQLQGVKILNINELAGALKAVVLPGENIEVKPLKEGKEHHQAIAYLDDGTMVVVEGGRKYIGKTIRIVTTSVLQTPAGRMVFAKVEPDNS